MQWSNSLVPSGCNLLHVYAFEQRLEFCAEQKFHIANYSRI